MSKFLTTPHDRAVIEGLRRAQYDAIAHVADRFKQLQNAVEGTELADAYLEHMKRAHGYQSTRIRQIAKASTDEIRDQRITAYLDAIGLEVPDVSPELRPANTEPSS